MEGLSMRPPRIEDSPLTEMSVVQLEYILCGKLKSLLDSKMVTGVIVKNTDNEFGKSDCRVKFVSVSVLYGTDKFIDFMIDNQRRVSMSKDVHDQHAGGRWGGTAFAVYVQACILARTKPNARTR